MILCVSSVVAKKNIASELGLVDYSYYFVLKEYLPVLKKIGIVVDIEGDLELLKAMMAYAADRNLPFFFLSFAPPHKVPLLEGCAVIPVFAWEYSTLPSEAWSGNMRNNWEFSLSQCAGAITHSKEVEALVDEALGEDYPVASVPAPVWDRWQGLYKDRMESLYLDSVLEFSGWAIDTDVAEETSFEEWSDSKSRHKICLSGVVYTAVFNPGDGRKNWPALLQAFIWSFRNNKDVVLVLKLASTKPEHCFVWVWEELKKLWPFSCRVVVVQGFLSEEEFASLISATHFIVNSSYGEGQCLPLMEFMSAGVPAIAPNHSGMNDYVNNENSFVVNYTDEWINWPEDPRVRLKTFRRRVDWGDLCEQYTNSYNEFQTTPKKYMNKAKKARKELRGHCSKKTCENRLRAYMKRMLARQGQGGMKALTWPFRRKSLEKSVLQYKGGLIKGSQLS